MRLLLDSVTASDIPFQYDGKNMELVAGYADGPYAWTPADWHRFPDHVRKVRICIWNNVWNADVLDSEPGNNDARGCVPWIKGKWERGEVPTIYCFSGVGPKGYRISDVRQACDMAGVRHPLFWIADWRREWEDFDPSGDPGIIALQYAGSAKTGGHFDASVVADHWPGVDKEEDMDEETVKKVMRGMLKSPEGALLVREALMRDTDDPDPTIETQLDHTEAATRRWIVGL